VPFQNCGLFINVGDLKQVAVFAAGNHEMTCPPSYRGPWPAYRSPSERGNRISKSLRWDLEQSCLRGAETVEKDRGQLEKAQGLKPSFLLWAFIGTTKQLGEKGGILERDRHQPLQGLKPDVDFIGFIGTTKVVP
jgi:hypothetical protein